MLAGKRVLVTGANGFIGSHLAERLVADGAQVRAFCEYNSNGSWGWLDGTHLGVKRSLDVRLGDVRDARFVEESCRDIEIVFHLAALIAIPYSYTAPESFIDTNVKGTLNVLEAGKRAGCHRIVCASTSEVYGMPESVPIRETHTLRGQSPYSASKIAADKLCEAYHCSFGVPVITLRPFNTYGPRQSPRAVLPTILLQLLAGRQEVSLGRLTPKRDLTFVTDTVDGFVRAGAVPGIEGQVIQLGTGHAVSIDELLATACSVVGMTAGAILDESRTRPDSSEIDILVSDPSKARDQLGWSPTVALRDGISQTAKWLEKNLGLYDPDRYHV